MPQFLAVAVKPPCADTDPEVFFPDPSDRRGIEAAKAYCRRCPLTEQCLTESLELDARYGVWGGLSEYERAQLQLGNPTPGSPVRPSRQPAMCGTTAGYDRHRRLAETTCPACRAAKAAEQRAYYQRQRSAS